MRNRQLIAMWVFEKGKGENVIERKEKEGKTYFVINDYKKLQALFGELLAEIQRVKSEGDFPGAKLLVENYAVKVEPELHKEVLTRYEKLGLAPYSGFVNPVYNVEKDAGGKITNITLDFSEDYITQMLRYSKEHSWLPVYN
jgi:dipeptidyl-peptidase-3